MAALDAHALWRVLVDALARRPDSQLIERDDWVQLRTPSSPYHTHNKILRARMGADEADTRIAEVRADHEQRGAGLTWIVDPQSRPCDLPARLDAAGFEFDSVASGMTMRVPQGPPPPLPSGVSIRPATVDDAETIATLSRINFGGPPSFATFVAEWVRQSAADPAHTMLHWLAFDGDTPVAQCTLRLLPGLGYMQGGSVLEHARGRGIYRALTWTRLAELRRRAIEDVVIWADDQTSGPIARSLGFEPVTSAHYYRLPDPPTV